MILAVTALAKTASVFSRAPILTYSDDLLFIPNWMLLLLASGLEFGVVLLLVKARSVTPKLLAITWLGGVFLLYRLGFWFIGSPELCPCLGSLTGFLPITPAVISSVMLSVAFYMFLGSIVLLCLLKGFSTSQARSTLIQSVPVLMLIWLPNALGAPEVSSDGPFAVKGMVTTTAFYNGKVLNKSVRPFMLWVDKCRVFVRAEPSALDVGVEYTEFGSDGTNCYLLKKQNKTKASVNDSLLEILPQQCPPALSSPVLAPWLAYGSGCYFRAQREDIIHTFWIRTGNSPLAPEHDAIRLKSAWQFAKHNARFLETYHDFRTGVVLGKRGEVKELPAELADNLTNNIFCVFSWTNLSGVTYPLEFAFLTYDRAEADGSQPLIIQQVGVANSIHPGLTRESYLPEMTAAVYVVDKRVQDEGGNAVTYLRSDKKLPSAEEVQAHADSNDWRGKNPPHQKNRRQWVAVALVVALGIPLIFVAGWLWRRVRNHN